MVECYRMAAGGSTVVKYLPYQPKVEGFSPVVPVAAGSGWEKKSGLYYKSFTIVMLWS
jgi:hypothetical protein